MSGSDVARFSSVGQRTIKFNFGQLCGSAYNLNITRICLGSDARHMQAMPWG